MRSGPDIDARSVSNGATYIPHTWDCQNNISLQCFTFVVSTGYVFQSHIALWKPDAQHINYIHDDELTDKYKAVASERARD